MSVAHIEIRRLAQDNAADAALYRDIRLEGLRANPEAFGSTFETENAQTLSWFFDRLGTSTVLGAFGDTKLVAIVGFAIQEGHPTDKDSGIDPSQYLLIVSAEYDDPKLSGGSSCQMLRKLL